MIGKDKDYRYMATSDLLNELNKEEFKVDGDLEIRLSNIILQQLDDAAGDVSGLAIKWSEIFLTSLLSLDCDYALYHRKHCCVVLLSALPFKMNKSFHFPFFLFRIVLCLSNFLAIKLFGCNLK